MTDTNLSTSLSNSNKASELYQRNTLYFNPSLQRNRLNAVYNGIAGLFSAVSVLPLILVLA
jgi:hypothetical protein